MGLYYLIYLIPLALIAGVVSLGFGISRRGRTFSPETSERSFSQLKKEIDKWLAEAVISQDGAKRIIERYERLKEKRASLKKSRLIKILATFGAVLVAVGVILLVASNWRAIPKSAEAGFLILATVGTYLAGWRMKYQKQSHIKIGEALLLLANLFFGASLILIAQIFHIRVEYSNLLLVWGLAILPLAFFEKSKTMLCLSVLAVMAWGMFSLENLGPAIDKGNFPLNYYLAFLITFGLFLPIAYFLKAKSLLALLLLAFLVWLGPLASLKWFRNSASPALDVCLLFLAAGASIFGLGFLHKATEKYRNFSKIYQLFGSLVILLSTFLLTFSQIYEIGNRGGRVEEMSFLPVFFNFVLLAQIAGAVYLGVKKEENDLVNLGIFFFGALVVARYFSITWSLSSRSFVFIGAGVLLLALSFFLDKLRRKILSQIKQ